MRRAAAVDQGVVTKPPTCERVIFSQTSGQAGDILQAEILAAPGVTPLAKCLSQWEACTAQPWILSTVTKGYRLQFATTSPICDEVIFSQANGQAGEILQAEVLLLLHKGAIQEVRTGPKLEWVLFPLLPCGKEGRGVRPILDLRALNRYLKVFRFRMLTNTALIPMVRQGDWFTSIDLKDEGQHVEIYPPHRKFLRFGFRGKIYDYKVLPFGLRDSTSTSPGACLYQ